MYYRDGAGLFGENLIRLPDGRVVTQQEAAAMGIVPPAHAAPAGVGVGPSFSPNQFTERKLDEWTQDIPKVAPTTGPNVQPPMAPPAAARTAPAPTANAPVYPPNPALMAAEKRAAQAQSDTPMDLLGLLAGQQQKPKMNQADVLMAIGSGMLGLSGDPNLQKMGMAGFGQVADRREKRQEQARTNRTLEVLKARGVSDADLALLSSDPKLLGEYASAMMKPSSLKDNYLNVGGVLYDLKEMRPVLDTRKPEKPIDSTKVVGGVLYDTNTNQVLFDSRDPNAPDSAVTKAETDLRKEFNGLQQVKDYQKQSQAFGRIVQAANDNSAAGDIALVFSYMKVLDPTSVVREGEFATAEQTAGLPSQIVNMYNKVVSGQRLTPDQRMQFVSTSQKLYQDSTNLYNQTRDFYIDKAGQIQLPNPQGVFPDYTWRGTIPASKPASMDDVTYEWLLKQAGIAR